MLPGTPFLRPRWEGGTRKFFPLGGFPPIRHCHPHGPAGVRGPFVTRLASLGSWVSYAEAICERSSPLFPSRAPSPAAIPALWLD